MSYLKFSGLFLPLADLGALEPDKDSVKTTFF